MLPSRCYQRHYIPCNCWFVQLAMADSERSHTQAKQAWVWDHVADTRARVGVRNSGWPAGESSCGCRGRDRRWGAGGGRRLLGAMALFFAGLPSPAGSQGAVGGGEPQAARMYDKAVELCGAGNARALEECNVLLQQSVKLFPDQALGHLTLGHTYRTLRAWNEAVSAFSAVIRCTRARAGSPEGAPDWAKEDAGTHLGRALIELDRWDEAILAFEATLTAFPANTEALFRHLYLQHFACNFTRRAGAHVCPYNVSL